MPDFTAASRESSPTVSMKQYTNKILLALIALVAVTASPLRAATNPSQGTFFGPQQFLGSDADGFPVYYLDYFGTYTYDQSDDTYVYKYNFGWLYDFGGSNTDSNDIYLYDFAEDDVFYTSPDLYPYFYSFNKDSFLYYFENTSPREFYEFETSSFIVY